jgi:hypothetical protein
MNDPAEIPTDLASDDIAERLEAAFAGAGWILGKNEETPHQATLLYRPRTRSPSYDLAGVAAAAERALVESVAASYTGRIGYIADVLIEWRGHEEVIVLGPSASGHYRGIPWAEMRASSEPFADLPAEVLEALRNQPAPDVDRMLAALVDHVYGDPLEAANEVALVEAYHPFDTSWRELLEPLFLEVRRRLLDDASELDIPGLVTFRRLDSDRGAFEAVHRPAEALRSFFAEESDALEVDLTPILGEPAPAIAAALEEACARACEGGVDVLVGADLAIHTAIVPPYQGFNPMTGEPMTVPGKKLPVFIGW